MPSQLILSTSTTRQYTALFLIEFSLELGCKSNDKRQRLNLNSHRVDGAPQGEGDGLGVLGVKGVMRLMGMTE